jgi:hypothetical protein
MLHAYDNELRTALGAEHAAVLREAAGRSADSRPSRRLRVRVGESLVRTGLRLAPDARPSGAHPARGVEIAC